MAIVTLDGYIAGPKQKIPYQKNVSRTTVALAWFTLFDLAGQPGAGTLNPALPNGAVPTDALPGFPLVNAFGGGAAGYLSAFEFSNSVPGRLQIVDRLFHSGQYGFAAATTNLVTPPSYSGRVPGGTDFTGLELWLQVTVAFLTGTAWNVTVSYTNQSGTAGRTATLPAALAAANLTLGRMHQFSLQAGDSGVQSIQSLTVVNPATAMTAGNFNLLVLRPLASCRVNVANGGDVFDLSRTGMPQIFDTSALEIIGNFDGVASGVPDLLIEIVNG